MTEKDYFVKMIKGETGATKRVIEALPADKLDYTPHEKSRTAQSLVSQIAVQPQAMISIIKSGKPDFNVHMAEGSKISPADLASEFEKAMNDLAAVATESTDEVWETKATMEGDNMKWETTRGDMVWGFLFDMVHHRGQLSTFIRPMGGQVPMIYGPSGDSK